MEATNIRMTPEQAEHRRKMLILREQELKFQRDFEKQGFERVSVASDGNCLYRSIRRVLLI